MDENAVCENRFRLPPLKRPPVASKRPPLTQKELNLSQRKFPVSLKANHREPTKSSMSTMANVATARNDNEIAIATTTLSSMVPRSTMPAVLLPTRSFDSQGSHHDQQQQQQQQQESKLVSGSGLKWQGTDPLTWIESMAAEGEARAAESSGGKVAVPIRVNGVNLSLKRPMHFRLTSPASSKKEGGESNEEGDISNRKRGGLDAKSAGPKKNTGLQIRLQPQQQSQQQQRNPLSVKKTPCPSKKKEVSFLPRPSQAKLAPSVVNILPDYTLGSDKTPRSIRQLPKNSNNNKKGKTAKVAFHDPVEEIEKSAGRLWIDEPDDNCYGSISLPGVTTLRQDWKAATKQQLAIRLKQQQEQEERDDLALEKDMEEVFASDEEAMLGADVWIERTHSFDDDLDDDLSFGAPSYCGDISF